MPSSLLILGGAQSGKSRFAVAAQPPRARVALIATPSAGGRSAEAWPHPADWLVIEDTRELAGRLDDLPAGIDAVVVDAITGWVERRLGSGDDDAEVVAAADALATLAARGAFALTLVSDEVGLGVHPAAAADRRFRDVLGLVNQRLAAACERVVLMVAGVPVTVKAPAPTADAGIQTA